MNHYFRQVLLQVLLPIAMTLNLELRCSGVENGEIYGTSETREINFTIASFAAMVVQSTGCDEQNESMGIIKNERDKFHYREFCSKWSLAVWSSHTRVGCEKQNESMGNH